MEGIEKMAKTEIEKKIEINSRFGFHKADGVSINKMSTIRKKVRELASLIEDTVPESREKATALTQLSFVMMSANSAIVQQCPIDESDFE